MYQMVHTSGWDGQVGVSPVTTVCKSLSHVSSANSLTPPLRSIHGSGTSGDQIRPSTEIAEQTIPSTPTTIAITPMSIVTAVTPPSGLIAIR